MLVKEIMTTRVKTARPDDAIQEVSTVMCLNKISGMPVVDEDNRIVGMLSEKDILHRMFPDAQAVMSGESQPDFEHMEKDFKHILEVKVEALMTQTVATVPPDMPVLRAAATMWLRKIRRIPVAEDNKLVGIISIGDVHKAIFRENLLKQ